MEIETRVAPVVKGRALALMSFSALGARLRSALPAARLPRPRPALTLTERLPGIVFADIGTSPLYVLNGIFPAAKGAPSSGLSPRRSTTPGRCAPALTPLPLAPTQRTLSAPSRPSSGR